MIGAVLGDIAGSKWEFFQVNEYYREGMDILQKDSFYTDDTVLYCATKYAIKNNISYGEAYKMFANLYPDHSYGGRFLGWMRSEKSEPYNSFGNGSAMRVGYIGEYFTTKEEVIAEATKSAECTHNHPEGIKSAVCTAVCTFLAKKGMSKNEIRKYIENECGYQLFESMEEMKEATKNDFCEESSQKTMPVALSAFLLSENFEDCMQKLLSVNCDTDTCCCIAGGIAENFYKETIPFATLKIRYYIKDKMLRDLILE